MNPSRIPQPGNRVSCLCLRCVRACVRAKICARDSDNEGQVAKCEPRAPPHPSASRGGGPGDTTEILVIKLDPVDTTEILVMKVELIINYFFPGGHFR